MKVAPQRLPLSKTTARRRGAAADPPVRRPSRSSSNPRLRLWSGGEAHQTVSLQRQTCLTSSNRTGKGLLYLYSMRLSEFVCLVEELPRDRRTSFSPMAAEDHITESLPASLSTALTQARMARATASAERAERASGSRSTSKDSVLTDRSLAPPDRISTRAKDDCFQRKVACLSTLCQSQDMFKKGVMSSMSSVTSQAGARSSASVRAFPREQLKRISDEIKEMREKYEDYNL
eukprot:s424_g10.t1